MSKAPESGSPSTMRSITRYIEWQSSNLLTGEGLDREEHNALSPFQATRGMGPDHTESIGLTLLKMTNPFHSITVNSSGNGPHGDSVDIRFINNYTHNPVQLMVTPAVKELSIGSMYSPNKDGPIEIHVDAASNDRLKLFLVGTYDARLC
ncbi:hypothetical protein [Candidatus Tisiphia endosymbiont of Nemotelus uliginosus]|uniref:hypothetical protein n=1 Tax=Candidatus Tisiphia endosymbiont of Nemotelus uliginosus TaxID=3077926 RepID=UPI0035C9010B